MDNIAQPVTKIKKTPLTGNKVNVLAVIMPIALKLLIPSWLLVGYHFIMTEICCIYR